jgi:hypothetical protein
VLEARRAVSDRKSSGIDATNQAYARYDQVEKRQEYHLAEGRHEEAFDEDYRIRTCDIGRFLRGDEGDQAAFARELGSALQEIGFAILEGHGIEPGVYEEAEARVADLFASMPPSARKGTGRSTRAISRSRRRATSIPTWWKAGSSAAALSTWTATRRSVRTGSGRGRRTSRSSGVCAARRKPCSSQ